MSNFNIIDILYNYCIENNIKGLFGKDDYINAIADEDVYKDNELILIAFFDSYPLIINGGLISDHKYVGTMALGRKCETDINNDRTESSLDETFMQKYVNRLSSLSVSLTNIIGDISCENEFDVSNLIMRMELNKFDLNADFVSCQITFST